VRGLVINGFTGDGIHVMTNGFDTISGNWIGTDSSGLHARGNGWVGVELEADHNKVGGYTAAERNVISGNGVGVGISAPQNVVDGNFIGTDMTGEAALGNSFQGIFIHGAGAWGNGVGDIGVPPNVISGNGFAGIHVQNAQPWDESHANRIRANFIGTDATGTRALGNHQNGIAIENSTWTFVGDDFPGHGNVIAGNWGSGVVVQGGQDDFVQSNRIGVLANGSAGGNTSFGVLVDGGANRITIGRRLPYGYNDGADGNVIANNVLGGISVGVANGQGTLALADHVTIVDNTIFANGGKGITLASFGNGGQAAPIITAVSHSLMSISWQAPSGGLVQFFENSPSGQTIIGETSGTIGRFFVPTAPLLPGDFITATVTGWDGTSEFSVSVPVGP
jgi:hypothetical protein